MTGTSGIITHLVNIMRIMKKLGALPLEDGGGAKHSPPGDAGGKIW